MALGAGCKKRCIGGIWAGLGVFPGPGVTAQAKKRLVLDEQVIGNSSMRLMAGAAVFNYRSMFIYKRPLIFPMAFKTQVIERIFIQVAIF